jgi:hypothetical protein
VAGCRALYWPGQKQLERDAQYSGMYRNLEDESFFLSSYRASDTL